MKTISYAILLLHLAAFPVCAAPSVEKPSQQGRVPSAADIAQPEVRDLPRTFERSTGTGGAQYILGEDITRDNRGAAGAASTPYAGTVSRFGKAYKAAGKPRLAVYLNRTLSDEVREWRTDSMAVVSGSGSTTSVRETLTTRTSETVKGPTAQYVQQHMDAGETRPAASEEQMWAFESGFTQPLLDAGAVLIDRATIMRLAAAKSNQGNPYEPVTVKKIEMDALVNHADIFVELLIADSKATAKGYEFRAVVKEVKTGRVLANVTSLNRPARSRIVTSDSGYEIVAAPGGNGMRDASRELALEMMNSLAAVWNRR